MAGRITGLARTVAGIYSGKVRIKRIGTLKKGKMGYGGYTHGLEAPGLPLTVGTN